jgi:hypothetical protein
MSDGTKRRGEKNGRAKMTWEFVKEARRRWQKKLVSSFELSYEADVSQSTMWQALTEKTWRRP